MTRIFVGYNITIEEIYKDISTIGETKENIDLGSIQLSKIVQSENGMYVIIQKFLKLVEKKNNAFKEELKCG